MWPATSDATPPDTCWIDALIALNAPRLVGSGTWLASAWNGIMREKMPTNITTLTSTTTASGVFPRWV